jgi:hypothetical protein
MEFTLTVSYIASFSPFLVEGGWLSCVLSVFWAFTCLFYLFDLLVVFFDLDCLPFDDELLLLLLTLPFLSSYIFSNLCFLLLYDDALSELCLDLLG